MRKLGVVALVVVGLLSVGQAILMFSSVSNVFSAQVISGSAFQISIISTVVAIAVSLAFGGALIFYRRELSIRLFDDDDKSISIDGQTLMRVAIGFLGLSILVQAIPGLVVGVSTTVMQRQFNGDTVGGGVLWLLNSTGVVGSLLGFIMATVLLSASAPLSRWLTRPAPQSVPPAAVSVALCSACGAAYNPADYRDGVERRCVECHAPLDGDDA